MAIHEDIPGISVSISVDDQVTQEYPCENDEVTHTDPEVIEHQEDRTITKYIECVEDQTFSVNIQIDKPYRPRCDALSFELFVDGEWIDTQVMCREDWYNNKKSFKTEMRGLFEQTKGGTVLKPFTFVKIKIATDNVPDVVARAQKRELAGVGEIELHIDRRKLVKDAPVRRRKQDAPDLNVDYSKKFHPKPLVPSGKTHGSTFGEEEPADDADYIETKTIDGEDFPMLIFKFKYRSKRALQSLLVVPYATDKGKGKEPEVRSSTRSDSSESASRESSMMPGVYVGKPKSFTIQGDKIRERPGNGGDSKFMAEEEEEDSDEGSVMQNDFGGLTNSQLKQLKHMAKSMKGKAAQKIKTENETPAQKGIKREANDSGNSWSYQAKKPKKMAGKITIDLTGDDFEEERAKRVFIELD